MIRITLTHEEAALVALVLRRGGGFEGSPDLEKMVEQIASSVEDLLAAEDGLRYVVDRIPNDADRARVEQALGWMVRE